MRLLVILLYKCLYEYSLHFNFHNQLPLCKAAQQVYHSRAYSTAWECFRESGMIRLVKCPGMELDGED